MNAETRVTEWGESGREERQDEEEREEGVESEKWEEKERGGGGGGERRWEGNRRKGERELRCRSRGNKLFIWLHKNNFVLYKADCLPVPLGNPTRVKISCFYSPHPTLTTHTYKKNQTKTPCFLHCWQSELIYRFKENGTRCLPPMLLICTRVTSVMWRPCSCSLSDSESCLSALGL